MHNDSTHPTEQRLLGHLQRLEGVRHPVTNPEGLSQAADYIAGQLQEYGLDVNRQPVWEAGEEYQNVLAERRGVGAPAERILVMAHYDTEAHTPGADDNASGVAVLLELARLFQHTTFQRTIQFAAVTLEESPYQGRGAGITRGSTALAEEAQRQGWKLTGVINMEMVGYAGDDLPQHAPPNLPLDLPPAGNFLGIIGNVASQALVGAMLAAVQREQIALPCVPLVVPGNGEMLPDTRRSDHAPFWDRGYPAIMLTDTSEFRNPHYHRESDRIDTLNLPFMAQVCLGVAALIRRLAVARE